MKNTIFLLALLLVSAGLPAWAALGQYEGSVTSDQQRLKSADVVRTLATYKVHQLTTTNGTTVREYVSPQGKVFGVAWQASFMPDMNQLLGDYINNLQSAQAAQTKTVHHRALMVNTSDFVYVNYGRLGFWRGYAYAPSLIPNNVSVEVVK